MLYYILGIEGLEGKVLRNEDFILKWVFALWVVWRQLGYLVWVLCPAQERGLAVVRRETFSHTSTVQSSSMGLLSLR